MTLTERRIKDAAPASKTRIIWDSQFRNFGVRIAPGGTKAFVLDYHAGGKHRRVTLARVGEMTLKQARALAGKEMARVRAGEAHLIDRRREAAEAPTVADTVRRFLTDYAERRIANGRMKRRTVDDYGSQCRGVILPALGDLPVAAVETDDVERMVEPLKPVMRNRILALSSRMFTLAEHWGWRPQRTNPARGIERSVERARDRTLSAAEFEALSAALSARDERNPAAVAATRFAAMTGLRIGEVLAVQWDHVDMETGALLLPDTKTGGAGTTCLLLRWPCSTPCPASPNLASPTGARRLVTSTRRPFSERSRRRPDWRTFTSMISAAPWRRGRPRRA